MQCHNNLKLHPEDQTKVIGYKLIFPLNDETHGLLQSGYRGHIEPSNDTHEGVEVADVEALPGHFYPPLDDPNSLLLFDMLWGGGEEGRDVKGCFGVVMTWESE